MLENVGIDQLLGMLEDEGISISNSEKLIKLVEFGVIEIVGDYYKATEMAISRGYLVNEKITAITPYGKIKFDEVMVTVVGQVIIIEMFKGAIKWNS